MFDVSSVQKRRYSDAKAASFLESAFNSSEDIDNEMVNCFYFFIN
jgi:hypothetical protein